MSVFFRNRSKKIENLDASILQGEEIIEIEKQDILTPELLTVLSAMPLNLPEIDPDDPKYHEKQILHQIKSLQSVMHLYNIIGITFWFMAGVAFFASKI